jgi:hypothetical protein
MRSQLQAQEMTREDRSSGALKEGALERAAS